MQSPGLAREGSESGTALPWPDPYQAEEGEAGAARASGPAVGAPQQHRPRAENMVTTGSPMNFPFLDEIPEVNKAISLHRAARARLARESLGINHTLAPPGPEPAAGLQAQSTQKPYGRAAWERGTPSTTGRGFWALREDRDHRSGGLPAPWEQRVPVTWQHHGSRFSWHPGNKGTPVPWEIGVPRTTGTGWSWHCRVSGPWQCPAPWSRGSLAPPCLGTCCCSPSPVSRHPHIPLSPSLAASLASFHLLSLANLLSFKASAGSSKALAQPGRL